MKKFSHQYIRRISLLLLLFIFVTLPLEQRYSASGSSDALFPISQETHLQGGFSSIQQAINAADNGSTLYIPSGTYIERIIVNKTVTLIGENRSTTIIDGNYGGTVVSITADNVTITGFTIQNSGWGWTRNGIYVYRANDCRIFSNLLVMNCHNIRLNSSRNTEVLENIIHGNGYGIRLINSFNCTAIGNRVSNCIGGVHLQNAVNCTVRGNDFFGNSQGIRLYSPCLYNEIFENIVRDSGYDGMIEAMPGNTTFRSNTFFHNDFINNTRSFLYQGSGNIWDDGYPSGGNYWSRYNGTDVQKGPFQNETGRDGIGDTPYPVGSYEEDRYPLMRPLNFLPVHNVNTGLRYSLIQTAIDANETLDGHTLRIGACMYYEHLNVSKSLRLIGEDRQRSVIDGGRVGKVVAVRADNVTISRVTIRNSGLLAPTYGDDCGLFIDHSTGVNISNCIVSNNRIGIYLYYAPGNTVENNDVRSNRENGVLLWYSGRNTLKYNQMANNSYNFGVFGGSFSNFHNSVDTTNVVDDRPIHYYLNAKDKVFDTLTNIGALYLINCVNITARNLAFTATSHGIFSYNSTNCTIENVSAAKNSYGVYLQNAHNNTVINNNCSRNWVGICLQESHNNVVEGNILSTNEKGLSLYQANYNLLIGNTIFSNYYGIRFSESHLNEIYHNNLIQNHEQGSIYFSHQNRWDNTLEGNFWSNFDGVDYNRDGLYDTSFVISNGDQDHYPLSGVFRSYTIDDGIEQKIEIITNSTILSFTYNASSDSATLTVNGTEQTCGFCRVRIPHDLIAPDLSVTIDGNQTNILYSNYTLYDDGLDRWIYIEYSHSIHTIVIVPEFTYPFILIALIGTCLSATIVRKKRE